MDVHKVSVDELCKRFNTNIETGLTNDQVREGQEANGANVLTPPPTTPQWVNFCKCMFFSPSTSLLWLTSIACFIAYGVQSSLYEEPSVVCDKDLVENDDQGYCRQKRAVPAFSTMHDEYVYEGPPMGNYYMGIVLCCLAIVTGFINFYCHMIIFLSTRDMEYLIPNLTKVKVRRNGQKTDVRTSELTLGDIVFLRIGDVVPADVRILKSSGLKVDNSNLTGESEPQSRSPEFSHDNPLETKNLAFLSTKVTNGKAVAMVVNIGDNTVYGTIAGLSTVLVTGQSNSIKVTEKFIIIISVVTLIICVALFVIAYLFPTYNWIFAIIFFIGLVPVLLNAKIKRELWATNRYMQSRDTYVRSMETIESLGSMSCLLTSKTGTITQNRMAVAHFWFDNKVVEANTSEEPNDEDMLYTKTPGWKILSRVASLCNSAEFSDPNDRTYRSEVEGNATDTAILRCTELNTGNIMEYRERNKMVAEIPFNAYNKYQVTIHETEDVDERYLVAMKGAPERIWERCSTIFVDGEDKPMTQELKNSFESAMAEMAGLGERLIGFCDLMLPADKYPPGTTFDPENVDIPLQDMRFVGLMSMIDPPRAAVPDAITQLRNKYGIKVIMVTGDHPITSMAIARSVGIVSEGSQTKEDIASKRGCDVEDVDVNEAEALLVSGQQLSDLPTSELVELIKNCDEIVFARAHPGHKIQIVEACRNLGLNIAVVGLDNEDVPSLKMADVGIVMGVAGDQGAKAAADIVLLQDNWGAVYGGVMYAKDTIAGALKKTIPFL